MKRSQNKTFYHRGRTGSRVLSTLLCLVMLVQIVPTMAFAKEPEEQSALVYQDPQDSENKISIACASSNVDEGGTYSFIVTRSSGETEETSVILHTVDVSAAYGEDYNISVEGMDTQTLETDGTVLEQSTDTQEQAARKAQYDQLLADNETDEETTANSEQTDEANQADQADVNGQESLAQLKEEQTGLSTREISQTEAQPLNEVIAQQYINSMGGSVETSSETTIVFAAGQTEKTVVLRILDDSQSEGSEMLQCTLTAPGDGYDIGNISVVQFTIVDDEPVVYSKVSFAADTFQADGGSVTVTIKRDDALYSLATAKVRSVSGGSAVAGSNYAVADEEISFAPYNQEVELTIPVSASRSETIFELEIYDLKGCQEGENIHCTVIIPAAEDTAQLISPLEESLTMLTASTDSLDFPITIDGKSYQVVYDGSFTGSIVDSAGVAVGTYFYMLNSASFNHFEGTNPGNFGNRESKFLTADNADDDTEKELIDDAAQKGVGYLYYYSAKISHNGLSTCYLPGNVPAFNSLKYQYAMADLYYRCDYRASKASGGFDLRVPYDAQKVQIKQNVIKLSQADMDERKLTSKLSMVDSNGYPVDQNYEFKFWAGDQGDGTPKTELYIYGAVAMYRKFKISLLQPDALTYLNADGTTGSRLPAQVELGVGHETRYAGQNLQLIVTSTTADGPIEGVLTGYQITMGVGDKQSTFTYTPSGSNLQNIAFDDDFIKVLNSHGKGEAMDGSSYVTNLQIKPIFTYKNVTVDVGADKFGSFTDSALTVGTGKNFHKGDVLSLASQPVDGFYSDGCRIQGYVNSSDTQAEMDGTMYTDTLKLTDEKYVISPRFAKQDNHITVRMTDEAQRKLRLQGAWDNNKLPITVRGHGGEYVLKINDGRSPDAYTPTYGQVYQITVLPRGGRPYDKVYRPVFTVLRTGQMVNGYTLDIVAQNRTEDNIILVDVEEVDPADLLTFAISGVVRTSGNSVRDSATAINGAPAMNVTLTAGSTDNRLYDTITETVLTCTTRYTAQTDIDGKYSIKGIKALDGDTVSVELRNGDVTSVEYVKLSKPASTAGTFTYLETVYDESSQQSTEQTVTANGYIQTTASFSLPMRSPLAPYVARVDYAVDSDGIADSLVDTRNNEIAIEKKGLTVTVSLNRNNRGVKKVIFSRISDKGASEEFAVEAETKDQTVFSYRFKNMETAFDPGDMLYVRLVDSESQVVKTYLTDPVTNTESVSETSYDCEYADVFTGLTLYLPTIYPQPQYYDVSSLSENAMDVPMLGNISSSVSSGTLTWNKTLLSDETAAPYYLSFYFTPTASNVDNLTAYSILNKVGDISNQISDTALAKYSGDVNLEQARATIAAAEKNYDNMSEDVKKFIDDVHQQETDLKSQGKSEDELIAAYDQSLKDNKDIIKQADQDYKESTSKHKYAKAATKLSGTKLTVNVQVLFQIFYTFNTKNNQYEMVSTQFFIGGSDTISYLQYWSVYGVPIYLKITGTVGLQMNRNFVPKDYQTTISSSDVTLVDNLATIMTPQKDFMVYGNLQAMVGAGLLGVLSARGVVTFGINYRNIVVENPNDNDTSYGEGDITKDGLLIYTSGGIGLDLLLFSFNYTLVTATYGNGVYEEQAGVTGPGKKSSGNSFSLESADVGSSDLGTFGSVKLRGGDTSYQVLLNNAAAHTKPQLIQLSEGRQMIVFVDRDPSRTGIDQMCLYYSVNTDGTWSAPVMLDDNGTADADPHVYVNDGKCLISWSDANRAFSGTASAPDVLNSLELAYRVYDIASGTMGDKTVLTDDNFMDNNAKFALTNDGDVFCYYIKRDLNNILAGDAESLADPNATYTTVAFRQYDANEKKWGQETYLTIPCQDVNDPLILDFDSKVRTFNGDRFSLMTYTVDADGNLQTVDDRDVYLMLTNLTKKKSFYPIRITNDYKADVSPQLTVFQCQDDDVQEEQLLLSWVSDGTDFCTINLTSAMKEIQDSGVWNDILSAVQSSTDKGSNPDWYKLSQSDAEELGITAENYHNSIFERLYTGHLAPAVKQFTNGQLSYNLSSYKLYSNSNALYLLWSETGGEDGVGQQELYGAVLDNDGQQTSWGEPVQLTDFGRNIDEFSAVFDSNQTMYLTANIFDQKVSADGTVEYSPNQIMFYQYQRTNHLALGSDISYETTPRDGTQGNFTLELKNNSMRHLTAYHITVEAQQNGASETILDEDYAASLLSGGTVLLPVAWTPTNTEGAKLIVTFSADGDTVTRSYDVPQESDVVITSAKAAYVSGTPQATVELFNQGNLSTGELTISAANAGNDAKILGSDTLSSLDPGQHRTVTLPLNELTFADLDQTGSTTVRLSVKGDKDSAGIVTVLNQREAALIAFDCADSLSMSIGDTEKVQAAAMPISVTRQSISYVSSNPAAVSVSQDGTLIANADGSSVITAYDAISGLSSNISVQVSGSSSDSGDNTSDSDIPGDSISEGSTSGGNISEGGTSDSNISEDNTSEGDTSDSDTSDSDTSGDNASDNNTSDDNISDGNSDIAFWLVLLFVFGGVLIAYWQKKKHRNKTD